MRLLFVTPQVTPYSGASPAGDACWALPKALKSRGHEVTILSPLYGFIDPAAKHLARRLRKIEVPLEDGPTAFQVFDARIAAGIDLVFLAHEELFAPCESVPRGGDPTEDPLEDGRRFGAFCKAAMELLRSDDEGFDAVHCHEWQTALVPVLVDLEELEPATVMTVHDVSRQGRFAPELVQRLALPERLLGIEGIEFYGKACFLKGGVVEADRVTTMSPTYAREITEDGGGAGLEGVFRARGKELVGITGGVDVAVWNPATDAQLPARFDPMDRSGKRRCKAALQRELELPVRDDVPLIGVLGPLNEDAGLDVLARVVSRVMRNDVQLVVVGEGGAADDSLVAVLREHSKRWPDRLQLQAEGGDEAVHRLLGGADALMLPPHQPPGGSMQMRAHRYGALPIGARAGAVADTVVDCDASLTTGDGFLYDLDEDGAVADDEVLAALQRAIAAFALGGAFEKARERALRTDHTWERSAYLYERLYASV
ncbi:MAG TPA: glycogen/starch synthase [Sandaracinaceae bacterium LLY-WYZ-13_1]|nr:glycogen/starch synthase [Sandaracinaceae bacterium LLY-WYZ-13_1]